MKVQFTKPTEQDYHNFIESFRSAYNLDDDCSILDGRVKIIAQDDEGHTAELFVEQDLVDRLGEEYICSHITVYYLRSLEGWFAKISENDYFNDPVRNPEKIIRLTFDGMEGGTGREIYKGIDTGRYYLREVHYPKEEFAKWYVCGKRRMTDDGDEPRANLIFEHNGQREKVRYDDWNGVAAYSDTFNKNFGP